MNRLILLFLLVLSTSFSLESQIYDPVDWTWKAVELDNGEFDIVVTAQIEDHWHVYSAYLDTTKIGPVPTSLTLNESADFVKRGNLKEGTPVIEYDPNFDMELKFFDHSAQWKQRIKWTDADPGTVSGFISFMTCNDELCLPPDDIDFEVNIVPTKTKVKTPTGKNSELKGEIKVVVPDAISSATAFGYDDQGGMGNSMLSGILEPVDWSWKAERIDEDEFFLVFTADIDEHWHVYSAYLDTSKIGPVPTAVTIDNHSDYSIAGELQEDEPVVMYDPNFDMDLEFFDTQAEFVQRVKWTGEKPGKVKGFVTYMACDDEKCLPPEDLDFEIDLSTAEQTDRALDFGIFSASSNAGSDDTSQGTNDDNDDSEVPQEDSFWGLFILAFFSGFAALLTPCVFPMIPLTVSFFTKQSKTRAQGISNALFYGICIIILYVGLGVGVSAIFGADAMNKLATDPWFNIAFFVLLLVFAASFLGAFEITLPNSWVNKADSASNKGGIIGIFFMAFTLALVSFSCTGPIVGTVLVEAAQGGFMGPIVGMFGFSLAIALPFALFAAFPGWLNSLPQSGGWLNSVKVVLGFLELALAFKFLSNADLVEQWHILERETFIAIWIIIFGMLTMYLLGFIRTSHDSPLPHINVTRIFMAVVTGAFTIYMIPGMWGAPLKLINAFPPPLFYSESPSGVGNSDGVSGHDVHPEGTHEGPAGLYVFHDYDTGLAYAKEKGLPVMLDFTGWACVNCRRMEENVWVDPAINRMLRDEVVLVSLYVDQREILPESEQKVVDLGNGKTRKLKRVGDKWRTLQELKYNINAQPYYVLMDHSENNIIAASSYQTHGTIPLFKKWLKSGVEKFNKR